MGLGSKDICGGGVGVCGFSIKSQTHTFALTSHTTVTSLPPGQSTAVDLCVPVTTQHPHQHLHRSHTSTTTYKDSEGGGGVGGGGGQLVENRARIRNI